MIRHSTQRQQQGLTFWISCATKLVTSVRTDSSYLSSLNMRSKALISSQKRPRSDRKSAFVVFNCDHKNALNEWTQRQSLNTNRIQDLVNGFQFQDKRLYVCIAFVANCHQFLQFFPIECIGKSAFGRRVHQQVCVQQIGVLWGEKALIGRRSDRWPTLTSIRTNSRSLASKRCSVRCHRRRRSRSESSGPSMGTRATVGGSGMSCRPTSLSVTAVVGSEKTSVMAESPRHWKA